MVAVLLIHMLKKAVLIVKPSKMPFIDEPVYFRIPKENLLCNPVFSSASAIMNPPKKRKIIESPYDNAVFSMVAIPSRGNKIIGRNEVAKSDVASVIHQNIIQSPAPKVKPILLPPVKNAINNSMSGPSRRLMIFWFFKT